MIKVEVLECFATLDNSYVKGGVYTLPANIAREFIKTGLAKEIEGGMIAKVIKPIAKLMTNEEEEKRPAKAADKTKRKYTSRKTKTAKSKK